jgi:hypothetical protein
VTTPIFKDQSFEVVFCLSRSHLQRIFEDVMAITSAEAHYFFARSMDATGNIGASCEAKNFLPLKTVA